MLKNLIRSPYKVLLSGKTSHAISGIIKRMCYVCTLYVYSLGDCPSDILCRE